ncbi:2-amino-4-hydroxy-6-hydroxymethyldihydropteridine diphosphokinase [Carboxylicivirga sp. M1479]|uniref:2-amino-4-hydroxy-6- hydroxymethyldihydropteridine diphosphokinase n=1 Tax=Carboxylicivirga sp. M1479 TaxID=2594476 RepID=UPI00117856AD|nr:2-amino-4-hydroxy-6-hydroxymethyldihydropteridine diphosphokinase [Carboxylicivirga sp. M1479]TRX72627.1 2-amino-4-hydroxy-6-hydroxymethyldihydropteridine diphosphokinase [Carboxylicivirga sp. M1479]
MNRQILLLGGNQGNVLESLKDAIDLLSESLGKPMLQSAYYESEPWGFEASQNFINQVVEFRSGLSPLVLLDFTQSIEKTLGRKAKTGTHYESRPIDIDILFIDDVQISTPRLTVPHSKLHERRFTLLPLMDHWSELLHPTLNQTIRQLNELCADAGCVKRFDR